MERVQVGSKIDKQLWQQLKARANLEDRSTGLVLDDAIKVYLKEARDREEKAQKILEQEEGTWKE